MAQHRAVLKLKHLVRVRPGATDHTTASREWRIAELHCADRAASHALAYWVELGWRWWIECRRIDGLSGEHGLWRECEEAENCDGDDGSTDELRWFHVDSPCATCISESRVSLATSN